MDFGRDMLLGLLVAIGGGLLVGIERERHKGEGPTRGAIGMRTCMIVAMIGAIASLLGETVLLMAGIGVVALGLVSYRRSRDSDPGLTTEFALLATLLLGAVAMTHLRVAAALFVLLTIILASKTALHRFARSVLNEQELDDALRLAASALIVLPLLPDHAIDPLGVLNPRRLWLFAVLVMSINTAGYVALRMFGPGRGLALAGLLGGFVSSIATIAGMGQRVKAAPGLRTECVAAALLSNIATIVQLGLILLAVSPELLRQLALPLAAAGATATIIAVIALFRMHVSPKMEEPATYGRPFTLFQAVLFAFIVTLALLGSALLRRWLGESGVLAAAAAAGFADIHAAAISLGQLLQTSDVPLHVAALALVIAFTSNSIVKCIGASVGGTAYALQVIGGIVLVNLTLLAAIFLR